MATFTSTQSGNWNDGATWGKTSPGTKGTDWPGFAGDVVNIGTTANQSHVVVYNVSETNQLGAMTIGATSGSGASRLDFSIAMNTKLTWADQDILIQATGELRVGASGANKVPYNYTAELVYAYNSAADFTKGIYLSAGGKLTVYGDPAYYGNKYDYILTTQVVIPAATNSVTVTITGNYQGNFVAGQELLIHKGGTYASITNDFARLAVVSAANNGANTDIACTVTERPAALTCLVGADVLNVSRNVLFYKLSYNANLGQLNTFRPRIANANTVGTSNISVNDVVFAGWYQVSVGYGFNFNGVGRNGYRTINSSTLNTISGLFFSLSDGINTGYGLTVNAVIANCANGMNGPLNCAVSARIFGCTNGMITGINLNFSGNIYACGSGVMGGTSKITGSVGYDANGIAKANSYDFGYIYDSTKISPINTKILNVLVPSSPVFTSGRNTIGLPGRHCFEHYKQVANAHYIADAFGDLLKVAVGASFTPTAPSVNPPSGIANVEAVWNVQSNCPNASPDYLKILDVRVWAAAGVSKTYTYFVQWVSPTSHTLTAAELSLTGQYLDNSPAGTGHLATATPSAQTIAVRGGTTDWTQLVSITINPSADGWVNLKLTLAYYESGAMALFVDPVVNIV